MSVYTAINQQQLEQFLSQYSLGKLLRYAGIQAGMENSNYEVVTSQGKYILTIYEAISKKELPNFLNYLLYLNQSDFPVPNPQASQSGCFFSSLNTKPAAFFNCIPGHSIKTPSIDQFKKIGRYLAQLHGLGKQCSLVMDKNNNITDYVERLDRIKPCLGHEAIVQIESELKFQLAHTVPILPQGIIHADLFKDNVLFNQGEISGILDFYNACQDVFIYDIAVTCNDWCIDDGHINALKYKALLSGYEEERGLTNDERKYLPLFLRRAALRFWLSRLDHQQNPKEGELVLTKDPDVFRQLLNSHQSRQSILNK